MGTGQATTMTLDDLAARLAEAFGDDLSAVVLYGSAARAAALPARDLNVLVIVRALTPAALRAAAGTSRRWAESGHPPLLVLTEAEWRSSRDVFAMEFADILERHRIVAGTLPAGPVAVDPAHLRHQLEFEAMGKLIRFRQALLTCEGDPSRELELLAATKGAVLALFRALLHAHGERAPDEAGAVVDRVAALAGIDGTPFHEVVAHATGTRSIDRDRVDEVLGAYHAGLKRFVQHVDAMVHPGHPPA